MRGHLFACLTAVLVMASGCTRVTGDTSQFYLAQTYLPLPPDELKRAEPQGSGPITCASGPVQPRFRKKSDRYVAQVLPGMMLHVVQTSYAASGRDRAFPIIGEWQWTIPAANSPEQSACADSTGTIPVWQRRDLVFVRSLLSGAQVPMNQAGPTPAYFEEAMRAACKDETGAGLSCSQAAFLDKFVAGLELNLRAQSVEEKSAPASNPELGPPFERIPPAAVLARTGAPPPGPRGYAAWYASLARARIPADLFTNGEQAARCRGPFADTAANGTVLPQDSEVCRFALTSLEWSASDQADRMPGASLAQIGRLYLLRSGDPLLLFQPETHRNPLDPGNEQRCSGNPTCLLADRTMQGFTDIELLIPITLDGGEKRWVPIWTTIADFEAANGVVVGRISRSLDWLPARISLEGNKYVTIQRGGGVRRRITLGFVDAGKGSSLDGGIAIRAGKADFLFAPGDIVTVRRR